MDLKKLLPLLLILMYATSVAATEGNIEEGCKAASDDLSAAGGCFNENDMVISGSTFVTQMTLFAVSISVAIAMFIIVLLYVQVFGPIDIFKEK